MAKLGRNDPCSCGSGNKYKRCCLAKDEAGARLTIASTPEPRTAARAGPSGSLFATDDNLDEVSNRVVDLLDAGHFAEAEQACVELEQRYPDYIDWLERRVMLHEKRGELQKAVEYARRCLQYALDWPDGFDEEARTWMEERLLGLEARQTRGDPERR